MVFKKFSMTMTNKEYIFIYGTLRKDICSSFQKHLKKYANFIGGAYVKGKLYDIGGYPGMIAGQYGENIVVGEIYKILSFETLFQILDEYEECSVDFQEPHEYKRKKINVFLFNGKKLKAWAYLFNGSLEKCKLIDSGDYMEYLSMQKNKGKAVCKPDSVPLEKRRQSFI